MRHAGRQHLDIWGRSANQVRTLTMAEVRTLRLAARIGDLVRRQFTGSDIPSIVRSLGNRVSVVATGKNPDFPIAAGVLKVPPDPSAAIELLAYGQEAVTGSSKIDRSLFAHLAREIIDDTRLCFELRDTLFRKLGSAISHPTLLFRASELTRRNNNAVATNLLSSSIEKAFQTLIDTPIATQVGFADRIEDIRTLMRDVVSGNLHPFFSVIQR